MEVLLLVLLSGLVGALVPLVLRPRTDASPGGGELGALREEVVRLGEKVTSDAVTIGRRLEGIDSRMTDTHTSSSEMARDIFRTLGEVRSATDAVAEQAREFSSLQDLLKPPKARGGLGEALLEELLRQVLPPNSYALQHRFGSGVIVDAVVKAGGRLVCIDSKFPLSNYRRMAEAETEVERSAAERAFAADVDRHMAAISTRYILPDENTFDFAVMYVPAEGLYGELLRMSHRGRALHETAMERRVMPMSPMTLYGYLQTILFGLRCMRIEESAQEILGLCGRLQGDIGRFAADYDTLGTHITNAHSRYEEGARRLARFQGKLDRMIDLADEGDDAETPALEVVDGRLP